MSPCIRLIIFTALLFGVALLYWLYDPAKTIIFPGCPFHHYTGWFCVGCGSQRAIHCLLHGQLLQAANYNLMLVLYLPLILVYYANLFFLFVLKRKWLPMQLLNKVPFIYFTLLLFIIFAVLRNTNTVTGIYLAP